MVYNPAYNYILQTIETYVHQLFSWKWKFKFSIQAANRMLSKLKLKSQYSYKTLFHKWPTFFSFIAKPNNYTILHADSLNINDSSPLKFIDGLKFILCIQARIEFWIINQKTPKVLYTSLTKIIKEVNKNSIFFNCRVLLFIHLFPA